MTSVKNMAKKLLLGTLKRTLVGLYQIIGPPQVLSYNVDINTTLLRAFGAEVGEGVLIHPPVTLYDTKKGFSNLSIGDKCVIHGNTFLDLAEHITLESGVSLGPGTTIMTHNRYNFNPFLEEHLSHTCDKRPVTIKQGSGIKARALITMGVTIGADAVVAGGAVVNRDVKPRSFVGGVPARLIKTIGCEQRQDTATEGNLP